MKIFNAGLLCIVLPIGLTVGQESPRTDLFLSGAYSVNYTPYIQVSAKRQFHSRFHVALGYGYRPVQDVTHNGSISAGYAIKRWSHSVLYIKTDLSLFKRDQASSIVDTEWVKHSLGFGYWKTLVSRLSVQIEINPVGFYYGTYKNRPSTEFGTRSFEGELKVGIGIRL